LRGCGPRRAASQFGDWLSFVALGALALDGGGGPLALVVVLAAHALPGAVVAPLAGALVDRYDRRRVLVAVELAMAGLTAAMALAAATGALATLPLLLLARSGLGAAVPAAETAAVRRLVDPDDLPAANAALAATWSAAYVLGMAAGGAAAMLGPTLALALDAGTFAVAAWLHGGLPPLPVTRAPVAADHRRGRGPERHRRRDDHRVARSAAPGRAPRQEPGRIGERRRLDRPQPDRGQRPALRPGGAVPRDLAGGARRRHRGWAVARRSLPGRRRRSRPGAARRPRHAPGGAGGAGGGAFAGRADRGRAGVGRSAPARTGSRPRRASAPRQRSRTIGRLAAMDELLVSAAMVASAFIGAAIASAASLTATALAAAGLGAIGLALVAAAVGAITAPRRAG
jgi:hypothetical protein